MWEWLKKKKEKVELPSEETEDDLVNYTVDFDELVMKVKLLSPKAQAALLYKIAGAVHSTVVDTGLRYFKAQKEHYAKSSNSRHKAGSGRGHTANKR